MDGYETVMRIQNEATELIPLAAACFDYGVEPFKKKWVTPGTFGTLGRLERFGLLKRVEPGGADANALYRFVDREGAGRAPSELAALTRP
jgi:hypothetical protein